MTRLQLLGFSALTIFSVSVTAVGVYLLINTDSLPVATQETGTPTKSTSEPVCDKKHSAFVFGYEFCYPKNWYMTEFGHDKEVVAIDPNGKPSAAASALIEVSALPTTSADALAKLRDDLTGAQEERYTLDGLDGTAINGTLNGKKQRTIITTKGRYAYLVTMRAVARTFDRHEPTFQNLLTTWKWIDITAHAPVRSTTGNLVVELPSYGSLIKSPATLKGRVLSFESHFAWRLKDATGKVIVTGSGTASSGDAGRLNPFSVLMKFTASTSDTGTLEVYTTSAKDGSEENLVIVPVKFR